MGKKYYVTLTQEERLSLEELVSKGKTQGYRIKHAQILLKLDEIAENADWTQPRIGEAYAASVTTVCHLAKRFVLEGLESALGRKKQLNRHRKVDGEVEARMVAIACSNAPEGHERWTLKLIAGELMSLGVVDYISDTTVMNTLKKTNSSLGKKRSGVFLRQERSS